MRSLPDFPLYRDASVTAYVRRIATTVAQQNAKITQKGQYKISGTTFYRVDYEFPGASPANLNVALTGRVGHCELSFQLNASTQEQIDKLFKSIIATTAIKAPAQRQSAP